MRVLVCGGRDFEDYQFAQEKLDKLHRSIDITHVISGHAKGADQLGEMWAEENCTPFTCYPANWDKHRKAAGPIRNQQMLDEGKPDVVLAFPGGRGTADMVKRAKKAGVRVIEVS